jgi:hypothetical protein
MTNVLSQSFERLLLEDVSSAESRLAVADTQGHRRDMIRTLFAAIEGMSWVYREHVRSLLATLGLLTPTADLALRDRSFTVTERGEILEQQRFVTLPSIIRLTTRQAQLIAPECTIDFSQSGWQAFKAAIDVRNRITHPKTISDLIVEALDLDQSRLGFFWLLGSMAAVMEMTNAVARRDLASAKHIIRQLSEGDEQTLFEYNQLLKGGDE